VLLKECYFLICVLFMRYVHIRHNNKANVSNTASHSLRDIQINCSPVEKF